MYPIFKFTRRVFLRAAALALVAFVAPLSAAPGKPDTLRILTIGNSFAYNATDRLPDFARAAGKTVHIFHANLGGASLERHVAHHRAHEANPADPQGRLFTKRPDPKTGQPRDFSLVEALESDAWDIVTIQQSSGLSFRPESYEPFATDLIAIIKKHAPKAEIVVLQTWAYRDDHPAFRNNPAFTPELMHQQLRAAYAKLAADQQLRLLPVGDAFHAARQTEAWTFRRAADFNYEQPPGGQNPNETGSLHLGWRWERDGAGKPVFKLDGFHANTAGCYLGGAVLFESLFGVDVRPLAVSAPGLDAEQTADLRRIAHQTVSASR